MTHDPSDARAAIEALIARIALGERAAFETLYDLTAGKLLAVTLRVLGDRDAAEDCLQDSFVKVWKNADRYEVNGLSPMTWLITIARNTAIDRLRSRRATDDIAALEDRLPASGPSPEASAIAASDARQLTDCLGQLPEDRRSAIRGAYLGGETYQDLADRFEVPLNTMRSWLRRSLIALRECMSP